MLKQDEIIEMARQAGIEFNEERIPETGFKYQGAMIVYEELEAFAKLVVAKEREACAKVCELESGDGPDNGCCPTFWNEAQEACAAAIRARGETTLRGEA